MKKINLIKQGIILGALAFGMIMMNSNAVKVEAAEATEQELVEVEELIDWVGELGVRYSS